MSDLISPIVALRVLLESLIVRAAALDFTSSSGLRVYEKISAQIARLMGAIAREDAAEFRSEHKARMLKDHGWRWKVICSLGGYRALDRWSRRAADPVAPAWYKADTAERPNAQTAHQATAPTPRFERFKTDESGWFRLAPIGRGSHFAAPAYSDTSFEIDYFETDDINIDYSGINYNAGEFLPTEGRITPISLTADELDLRGVDKREDAPETLSNALLDAILSDFPRELLSRPDVDKPAKTMRHTTRISWPATSVMAQKSTLANACRAAQAQAPSYKPP